MPDAKAQRAVLIILDGFGINPSPEHNAVAQAQTPVLDNLFANNPFTQLDASESQVGLPQGFMGNSEVGHLNIGAGRIVYQDFSLISKAIDDGTFYRNPAFVDLCQKIAARKGATLHLMGLVSDGGVHSHISHLYALVRLAAQQGISKVAVHVFTDGRDTSPTSALGFVTALEAFLKDAGLGEIATVQGRFYAMDRDNRWERTQAAYEALVDGKAAHTFTQASDAVRGFYDERLTDEFLPPAVRQGYKGIRDGDGIIFINFRADRARQITRALTQTDFEPFVRPNLPTLSGFVMMSPYDASFPLPFAYGKPPVENTLGDFVSKQGWKQLRIAETEKYAHVTYFFNGGDEKAIDGEKRILVPSPRDVRTYDLKPEMSALAVTDQLLAAAEAENFQLIVVNFANCDMVGHTGNLPAAIRAVETVDACVGRVLKWVDSVGGFAVLTADHGNCELMQDANGVPLTSHTLLPVPFVVHGAKRQGMNLKGGGKLCDIAPTIIELWGLQKPKEMTGQSLIEA
ncbi:2,3-bisphosphoglycerate-independent phosphoglycerate mutase [bacterium]|nr:2,3-bisphosphoglycerate-independent phosphoglycerate mutase [bacterium]